MYDNKILTTLSHVLMTQKEAAEYLHTTVGTLNTWRHYGKDKIPFVRWGNRIRYRKEDLDARYSYFRTFTNLRDVGRYLQALARVAKDHIANRHRTFQGELSQDLADLSQLLVEIVGNHNGQADVSALHANAQTLLARIETIQEKLLRNGPDKGFSARGCELFLSFLLFARELINHYEIIAMLQQKLNTSEPEKVAQNKS